MLSITSKSIQFFPFVEITKYDKAITARLSANASFSFMYSVHNLLSSSQKTKKKRNGLVVFLGFFFWLCYKLEKKLEKKFKM